MASKRLGRLLLALVAVWTVAGLDSLANAPNDPTQLLLSPTPAYAGDPDDVAGNPEVGGGEPTPPPPPPEEEQKSGKSLWDAIVAAVGSLIGGD